jgi:curved DNA-binding protein CbpA
VSEARDYYKVLQVDPAADPEVINAAYRALAKRLHPDHDAAQQHEDRMAELNRAYAALRDPERRRAYDAERAKRPPAPEPPAAPPPGGGLSARMNASAREAERDDGSTRLNFGRYAGATLREIARKDREYLQWLSRHSSGIRYRREISQLLKDESDAGSSPGTQ